IQSGKPAKFFFAKMKSLLIIFYNVFLFASVSDVYSQQITWQRVYGGAQLDYGKDGVQTFDGGYIVLARSNEHGNMLLKLDSYGNEEWSRSLDNNGICQSIKQSIDSSYIIAYSHDSLAKIIKTDKMGNLIWRKYYTINNDITGFYKINILDNGDMIMCGAIFSQKAYVVKTDALGNLIWQTIIPDSSSIEGRDITESNNFYYLTGNSNYKGHGKTLLTKLSFTGQIVWHKLFGSEGKGDGESSYAIIAESENIITTAGILYDNTFSKTHLSKFDSSGHLIIQYLYESMYTFGGMTKYQYGYALCGASRFGDRINFIKVNFDGTETENRIINYISDFLWFSNSINKTSDNGFVIAGMAGLEKDLNILVIKTDSIGYAPVSIKNINSELPASFKLYQNYPNPFNPGTNIKYQIVNSNFVELKIYDVLGKQVATLVNQKQSAGTYSVDWNASNFPSGVYFYSIKAGSFKETKRMILLK
ncbi:MAG: T9SS type A sorting domain-containing protein, partial [bacterium]